MGMFSWMADAGDGTMVSLSAACCIDGGTPPVYLKTPDGGSFKEDFYEGYGIFDGMDAFWLVGSAQLDAANISVNAFSFEKVRSLGILISSNGPKLYDDGSGVFYADATGVFLDAGEILVKLDDRIKTLSKEELEVFRARALRGEIKQVKVKDILEPAMLIKLTFNPKASYDSLRESPACKDQGFFYPDDEIEELEDAYRRIRNRFDD